MASLSVSGICRITRDAEVRKSGTGTWFSFGVAAYRKNAKEGKQTADFFDADLYQKIYVNNMEKKLSKGRLIYIENGYLRNDQFAGPDGKPRTRVKLQISTYEILNDDMVTNLPEAIGTDPTIEDLPKEEVVVTEKSSNSFHPNDLPPPPVPFGMGKRKKIEKKPVEVPDEEPYLLTPEDLKFSQEPDLSSEMPPF